MMIREEYHSYIREYVELNRSVLRIYDLRLKISAVYVFGLLSSVYISISLENPIGFIAGIFATGTMMALDYSMHQRQTLFSYRAAQMEKRFNGMRFSTDKEPYGVYGLYFKNFWNLPNELEELTFNNIRAGWLTYFGKSRGWVYAMVIILLAGYYIWCSLIK